MGGLVDDHCPLRRPIDLVIIKADDDSAEFLRLSLAKVEYVASPDVVTMRNLPPPLGVSETPQKSSTFCPGQQSGCIGCYFRHEPVSATFTGTIRFAGKEPGREGFGHLGMLDLHLDATSVTNIEAMDRLGNDFDTRCWRPKNAE